MSNPVITLANDVHRDKAVVSLRFEKDYALIDKVNSLESIAWNVKAHGRASLIKSTTWSQSRGFWYIDKEEINNYILELIREKEISSSEQNQRIKSSLSTEIYPVGIYYNSWKSSINTEFSNRVNTHVSQKDFAKFKNPFDDDFFDSS